MTFRPRCLDQRNNPELKVLRAWRVIHFSEYVDAIDEARRLGYQEEYPPGRAGRPDRIER